MRARQPFAQPPSVEQLVPLPAEITVAVGVVDDRACRLLDRVYFVRIPFVAAVELLLGGEQPLVAFYDREPAGRFFSIAVFLLYKYMNFSIFVQD